MGYEVDLAFIQPLEQRPKLSINEAESIPLIDLSPLNSPNSDDPKAIAGLVAQIGAACSEWGFFQVINHGVPWDLRRRVESASKKFFDLPLEEKRKVQRDEVNPMGYYDTEHTKNVRDWKEVFDFAAEDPTFIPVFNKPGAHEIKLPSNQWPEYPPEFREACTEYSRGVQKLAFKLLELISLSLNLPRKRLNGFFEEQTTFLRLNHYPPCPSPHLALGVGRHKDSGALTVLAQDDVGGLEVKRKIDGEWIRVKPVPDSYIINVGDIIQVWSNDKYESVEHRVVVNEERERFSIPLFFNPAQYVVVKPLEELINEENPPKFKEYSWGDFFKARVNSNFKKMDVENVQVDHFKISV
ncbi:protein DMR6-LIKE OXYGENASE 2-like [Magnolia sinica]|uniref:protein DMR6-LIKE OXYGENASE 2-like n=1 Tax=Magnolia sinica TaxID=86752 RepID=UPI002658E5DC|nr:protein DMR6-LIKE OXYGENASE 2-like [Magnolia sinica]